MAALTLKLKLNHNQIAPAIVTYGQDVSTIVLGEPGIGKTAILKMLAKMLPTHTPVYLDCPWQDVGDLGMNVPFRDEGQLRWIIKDIFTRTGKPLILMLDELFKSQPHMKPILTTVLLERRIGDWRMPDGSLLFATSNNVSDGVGDRVQGHEGNRVSFIQLRKPPADQWCNWGRNHGIHPAILTWAEFNPTAFASYLDGKSAENNPFIFNPRTNPVIYVSPRSLEKASHILKGADIVGDDTTLAYLHGTVGEMAAESIFTMHRMDKEIPKVKDAIRDPQKTLVPTSPASQYLFMNNATAPGQIETAGDMAAVTEYVGRFNSRELGGVFYNLMFGTDHLVPLARTCNALRQWGGKNIELL